MSDTIYALSSGSLPAGVAVIRVSGPGAERALVALAGARVPARRASLRRLTAPATGEPLDQALVLWLPGPASFTGEDVVELHCHGGRAVVAAVLDALGGLDGLRPAEPGEFTRRAFDNDRLDRLEVEGLADLVAADTEAQRRQALAQAGGALSALYDGWRSRLVRARALIEAEFDFADEDDVPDDVSQAVWSDVAALAAEVSRHLDRSRGAERLRSGLQVVLLGPPNAGKSSLLNALARRDVAIVAEEAGTTRDLIDVHLDLDGLPVTVTDTAGLRDGAGRIEREGMRRALARAAAADLALWLDPADGTGAAETAPVEPGCPVWRLVSKADLAPGGTMEASATPARHHVSVATGAGLDGLVADLKAFAGERLGGLDEPVATRERQRRHLAETLAALAAALGSGADGDGRPLELRAEDLRRASDALGRIAGRTGVEDLLDVVFREFCIGK